MIHPLAPHPLEGVSKLGLRVLPRMAAGRVSESWEE